MQKPLLQARFENGRLGDACPFRAFSVPPEERLFQPAIEALEQGV